MKRRAFCLIINADDFGYSSERDQGIIECFQKSAISSASLMVTGVNVVQAVERAKKENLPLGLHLNLTEGVPVGGAKYHNLVTPEGVFRGKFGLRKELKKDTVDIAEGVFREKFGLRKELKGDTVDIAEGVFREKFGLRKELKGDTVDIAEGVFREKFGLRQKLKGDTVDIAEVSEPHSRTCTYWKGQVHHPGHPRECIQGKVWAKEGAEGRHAEGVPIGRAKYHTLVTPEGVFREKFGLRKELKGDTVDIAESVFRGKFGLRKELKADTVDIAEVREEIHSQIKRFQELVGCLPFHVDGHQHIHIHPGICEVFAEILQSKGITVTRLPVERCLNNCDWIDSGRLTFYQEVIQQSKECQDIFIKHKLSFAPAFVGLSTCGKDMSIERLRTALDAAFMNNIADEPMRVCELMVHPGYPTGSVGGCELMVHPGYLTGSVGGFQLMVHPGYPTGNIGGCELMVHPGYPTGNIGGCGTGPDEFSKSADRKHEMDILQSADFKQYLNEKAITVSSFEDTFGILPS
ncbi:carbohydrate deacetylase-like [Liolophura sinensis]|uniref:carbohydrate deacetylase-like n=1 Tax=Liolophura sinensis TaxID=3198878 RepID=UPI0031582999